MSRIEAEISDTGDVTVECSLDAPPEKRSDLKLKKR